MSFYLSTNFPGRSETELVILNKLNELIDFSNLSFKDKLNAYNKVIKNCKNCTFYSSPTPSLLRDSSRYLFIGRSPLSNEPIENELEHPTTKASKLFNIYLHRLGINPNDISYINLTCCTGHSFHVPNSTELKTCAQYKATEFDILGDNFSYIFLMGDDVVKWFLPNTMIQQAIGNTYSFLQESENKQITLIPIYQPYHMLKTPQLLKYHLDYLKTIRESILSS